MSECAERICYLEGMCKLFGECSLKHRLLHGQKKHVYDCIRAEVPAKREKMYISFLSEKEKMKVRGYRVGSYYKWKGITGIDPDKQPIRKKKKKAPKQKAKKPKRVKVGITMRQISKEVFKNFNNILPPATRTEAEKKIITQVKAPFDLEKWRNEPEPNFHEPD